MNAAERGVTHKVSAVAVSEGAGVRLQRAIGHPGLQGLDPFLMLDHFSSSNPGDYIAGFPDHPHRGFVTLTYMLDGHMRHQDSLGNRGELRAGGAQWMKAARGVIHSEMPQQDQGLMRGFQLWINLPAREKMSAPHYQEYQAAAIPPYSREGLNARVLAGTLGDVKGPIEDPCTDLLFADITLAPGAVFAPALAAERAAFLYVFEGALAQPAPVQRQLAVLGRGDMVRLEAGPSGARLLLVAGRPLGEPVAHYGPFVMNTQAELETALDDYRHGRLVR